MGNTQGVYEGGEKKMEAYGGGGEKEKEAYGGGGDKKYGGASYDHKGERASGENFFFRTIMAVEKILGGEGYRRREKFGIFNRGYGDHWQKYGDHSYGSKNSYGGKGLQSASKRASGGYPLVLGEYHHHEEKKYGSENKYAGHHHHGKAAGWANAAEDCNLETQF